MFDFWALFGYAFVMAITPGPNNITSMGNGARCGIKKSLPFNVGVFCGVIVITAIAAALGTALYSIIPGIKPIILVIGAAYILWLAWKTWRAPAAVNESDSASEIKFSSGVLLQFLNPKTILCEITAMTVYILPYYTDVPHLALYTVLLAALGFVCTVCWLLFGAVIKKLFARYGRIINAVMALLLVYCAISLFF